MSPLIIPRWVVPIEPNVGPPALADDIAILGAYQGKVGCTAIRIADGSTAWHFNAGGGVGGPVKSKDGIVYFCADTPSPNQQSVIALEAKSGKQKWWTSIPFVSGPLLLVDDNVIVHGASTTHSFKSVVSLLDKATGSVVQSKEFDPEIRLVFGEWNGLAVTAGYRKTELELLDLTTLTMSTIANAPSPIQAGSISGSRCYVVDDGQGATKCRITAIRLTDGHQQWSQTYDMRFGQWILADNDVIAIGMRSNLEPGASAAIWCIAADNGAVLWKAAAGAFFPIPCTIVRGTLLVQFRETTPPGSMVTAALDLRNGHELFRLEHRGFPTWVVEIENGVVLAGGGTYLASIATDRLWGVNVGGAVRATPAIADGVVLVGNANSRVSAIALDTGQMRWTRSAPGPVEGGPAIQQGRVFAGHGGGITAFETLNGHQAWSIPTSQAVTSPILASQQAVVFGCRDGAIRAVHPQDGSAIWSFQTQGFVEGGVVRDNALYFSGSGDGHVYALDANGELAWRFAPADADIDEIKSTPLVVDATLIIGNAGGHLYALDTATGKQKWHRKIAGGVRTSAPLLHINHFWVGDESGHVYHIVIADGSIDWQTAVAGPVRGRPAWLGGELYVGTIAGTVDVLDILTGKRQRSIRLGASVFASPVATAEFIVVADEAGGIYAIVPGI